jgi:hypothetical protein
VATENPHCLVVFDHMNKDLLKSFIRAPSEFINFIKSSIDTSVFDKSNNCSEAIYRSICEKDYLIVIPRCYNYSNLKFRLGSKLKTEDQFIFYRYIINNYDIIPLDDNQYKQFLINFRSKYINKYKNHSGQRTFKDVQTYKKTKMAKDILISIYHVDSKKSALLFNPFVKLEERKYFNLTVSQVKKGAMRSLPFLTE